MLERQITVTDPPRCKMCGYVMAPASEFSMGGVTVRKYNCFKCEPDRTSTILRDWCYAAKESVR